MEQSDRYNAGWAKLREIDGNAGEKVIDSLKDISPDLGKFIIEYAFGDIYTRENLDLKSKEMAVVAALTAMGTALPQLKVHLNGALNTGSSINELKEIILQMSIISGFPSSVNGMNALRDVLKERQEQGFTDVVGKVATKNANQTDRLKIGEYELSQLDSLQVNKLKTVYNEFAPELVQFTLEYGYADIFSRDNLNKKYRQIANIAALTAIGNIQQLKFHISAGLNIGLTVENIKEIMLLMSVYAGFPSAINGTNLLKEVISER